ncbi:MAG: hypothetical protein GX616_01625 [Planctomycetes bacterium]|nr:hypothetical protein [Planctomycetota bacterium]
MRNPEVGPLTPFKGILQIEELLLGSPFKDSDCADGIEMSGHGLAIGSPLIDQHNVSV